MSASMYWQPVVRRPDGECVDDALRYRLARRLWSQDGSSSTDKEELDESIVPYLEGLRDGGVEGADEMIKAIRQHGQIEVWIDR